MTYINRKACQSRTNAELLEMLQDPNRQKEAIGCIYVLAYDKLQRLARKYGQKENALDIANEGVIILIKKVETGDFSPKSNLIPFYLGICRNLMLEAIRDRKKREKGNASWRDAPPDWQEVPSPEDIRIEIEEIQAQHKEWEAITHKVSLLGEVCQKIIKLRHWHKDENGKPLSWAEIAKLMGYTTAQVAKNTYGRCKSKLLK